MKQRLFHKGFYIDTLQRIKGFSIATFVFSIAVTAINAFIMLSDYLGYAESGGGAETEILSLFDMVVTSSILATVFVPILMFMAFVYLYRRNESDFFETIPVNRVTMAISGTMSVLTVLLASVVGSILTYLLITIPCIGKLYVIDPINFWLELLAVLIAAMFSAAVSLLGISVTGTISSGIIVAVSVAVIPRIVMTSFLSVLEGWSIYLVEGKIVPLFNSSTNIYYALLTGNFLAQQTPWNYVYTAVLSVVIYVIATVIFVKRGSESISHKFVKNVHRHIAAVLLAILPMSYAIAPLADFSEMGFLGIILVLVSIGVFVAFEIFGNEKRHKNRGGLIAFIALIVVTAAYSVGLGATAEYLDSYAPKANEIEYVSIVSVSNESDFLSDLFDDYSYLEYQDYAEMRAESIEIRDREIVEIISKALAEKGGENDEDKQPITVKIKSGGKLHYRKVYLLADDYSRVEAVLASNEKYNEIWQNIDEGARYPSAYYGGSYIRYDLLGNVLETMESEIVEYGVDRYRASVYYELPVCEIDYTVYIKGKEYSVSVPIFEYMTKSVEMLEKSRKSIAESEIADLASKLDAIASGDLSAGMYVNYYGDYSSYYMTVDPETSDIDFSEFSRDLMSIVSSDSRNYSSVVYMSLYSNELWGSDYYYTFAVDSSVSEESIKEFFVKYGAEVYE